MEALPRGSNRQNSHQFPINASCSNHNQRVIIISQLTSFSGISFTISRFHSSSIKTPQDGFPFLYTTYSLNTITTWSTKHKSTHNTTEASTKDWKVVTSRLSKEQQTNDVAPCTTKTHNRSTQAHKHTTIIY